jgi:hypothetical protein
MMLFCLRVAKVLLQFRSEKQWRMYRGPRSSLVELQSPPLLAQLDAAQRTARDLHWWNCNLRPGPCRSGDRRLNVLNQL